MCLWITDFGNWFSTDVVTYLAFGSNMQIERLLMLRFCRPITREVPIFISLIIHLKDTIVSFHTSFVVEYITLVLRSNGSLGFCLSSKVKISESGCEILVLSRLTTLRAPLMNSKMRIDIDHGKRLVTIFYWKRGIPPKIELSMWIPASDRRAFHHHNWILQPIY